MPEEREPPRRATALRYTEGSEAPEVVATGRGEIARKILVAADEAGVPVRRDLALVEALSKLDVGRTIPPELVIMIGPCVTPRNWYRPFLSSNTQSVYVMFSSL